MRNWLYMPDLYEGDRDPDWAHAAQQGVTIVALKATEGTAHVDIRHAARARAAHNYGFTVVHYHFCKPFAGGSSPKDEARFFWRIVKPTFQAGDTLALDFERDAGTPVHSKVYIEEVHAELLRLSKIDAMVYGSTSFLGANVTVGWLRKRRRWQAQYGTEPGWGAWLRPWWAWQFTDGQIGPQPRRLPGFDYGDVSRLRGDVALRLRVRAARRRRRGQQQGC